MRVRHWRLSWPWWPAALIALAGVGAILRQWVAARPLWLDEEMIAINVRDRGLFDLAGPLWLGQSSPLGWLAFERLSVLVLGQTEIALRAMPVAFGIATIAAAMWMGRRVLSPASAAVLVVLVGLGTWIGFHALELKPYSSDVFWALLLPALAEWASRREAEGRMPLSGRLRIWWIVAAAGQWFGNGALFVAPACALALFVVLARRDGWAGARHLVTGSAIWLGLFGLHYQLALRHTLGNRSLEAYWAFALPPADSGVMARLSWIAGQIEHLAVKPGGSSHWIWLWATAVAGLAWLIATRPVLGLVCLLIPISAFLFGALRIVPLYERLSLWIVPALYVGVASAVDLALRLRRARPRVAAVGSALALGAVVALVTYDVALTGWGELGYRLELRRSNHQVDDRGAMTWLMSERRDGDIVLTPRYSLPAVWWYGAGRMTEPDLGGNLRGNTPDYQLSYLDDPGCRTNYLEEAASGHARALVYLGFRSGDVPRGFDAFLFSRLGSLGRIVSYREFAEEGRAAVVDFREPPLPTGVMGPVQLSSRQEDVAVPLTGCLGIARAVRWE